ncbi:uncharacterized protein MELLADRAFT_76348 [Melampsora larici-populina 98AG31]|uniref:Uncharacterized protein n=1 Tax=Melampsora larici-populina (strain 98AG31 / pathotype 3-4-7) TaxID=747676 RepID=F4R4D6_MELLP|nr:uncharacterized protein MELLADRAFT_76348 [Melampsora larici-populina 98AG31]EGG12794.1 hypothetical protein MELLADRAFT_76348 [Melampsora larici-populina 98AG31]
MRNDPKMNSTLPLAPPPNYDEAIRSNEQTRLVFQEAINSNEQTRLLFQTNHHSQQAQQQQAYRQAPPPPPPPQGPISIHLNHQTHSSSFQFIRLLGFFSLILSILFTIIISLSITHQSKIFYLNSFIFSHFSSFEIPIYYSILSFLIIHLVLVNLNHHKSFSILVHHTIHFTQFNILIQVFVILFDGELRSKESGLTLLSATILLGALDLAKFIHSSTHSQQQVRTPLVIHNVNQSLSFIRPSSFYLSRNQNNLSNAFKRFRFIGYSIFITLNTLILTTTLLLKASDSNPVPSDQLHTVEISFPTIDHHYHHHHEEQLIETSLQMKCEWLNQPNPSILSNQSTSNLPIKTNTILLFSPSAYTAKESSRWISSIESFKKNDLFNGIRFCQFDRPGYDHSFNLPMTKISDSVNVMDQVLNQIGEFDQIQKNWNGIRHSGFIVVGHGYGALEAKVFVSKHPHLIKSILYIDPETEDTFFNLDQDLTDSPLRQFSSSLHNMYKIFISSWKYTISTRLSILPIKSISPSMTRSIIQESTISFSILAYDEFIELTKPNHLSNHFKTKVLLNPHKGDHHQFKGLEICMDFMQSTCQESLMDLVYD